MRVSSVEASVQSARTRIDQSCQTDLARRMLDRLDCFVTACIQKFDTASQKVRHTFFKQYGVQNLPENVRGMSAENRIADAGDMRRLTAMMGQHSNI